MIARNRLVCLLDQVGAGNADDAMLKRFALRGIIRHVKQMIALVPADKGGAVVCLDLFDRNFPSGEECSACCITAGFIGKDAISGEFALMTVKLPCLRAAPENGKRPLMPGCLEGASPDDGAGAPCAMEQRRTPRMFQPLHVAQKQAVRQAIRPRNCEFTIFGSRPYIKKLQVSLAFEIRGRGDFR